MPSYALTADQASRVAAAVRYVEGMSRGSGRTPRRRNVTIGGSSTNAIAVLTSPLYYGSTNGATATLYTGTPGNEKPGDSITVYEWMLLPGDVIAAGVAIGIAKVNGLWYLRNAACGPMPYPRGSG